MKNNFIINNLLLSLLYNYLMSIYISNNDSFSESIPNIETLECLIKKDFY